MFWFGKPAPEVPRLHTPPKEQEGGWRATVWGTLLRDGDIIREGDVLDGWSGMWLPITNIQRNQTVAARFPNSDPRPTCVRPVAA